MKRLAALACLGASLMLAGCSETHAGGDSAAVTPLDAAAIEAGVISDPMVIDLAGSFADTGGAGSDAFCARGNRDQGYSVGILVSFGGSSQCEGQGRAALSGERVRISLTRNAAGDAVKDCSFTARFDGSALALAGKLPASCQALCSSRASLAGASFALVETGDRAAGAARGRAINRLCGN